MDNITVYNRKNPMTREHYARLFEIMEYSFPADERRDFEEQFEEFRQPLFHCICRETADRVEGFMNYWDFTDFLYLEHFAVARELRGQGIGTQFIRKIRSIADGRPIILEAEPPELSEAAASRIAFYERLGFTLNPHEYYQPPYRSGEKPLRLVIMSDCGVLSQEDFLRMRSVLYREAYCTSEAFLPKAADRR